VHAQAENSKDIKSLSSKLIKESDLLKSELKHSVGNAWAELKRSQVEDSKTLTNSIQNQKKELELSKHELKHEIGNMKSEIRLVNEVFNPRAMRNINANIGLFSSRLKGMEKESDDSLRALSSVDRRIGTIERRALEVESDYHHAKDSAEELQKKAEDLKHTARLFMGQMDQFHSKTNAEFNKMIDMERQLEDVQQRLSMIEDVKVNANSMENAISENTRIISELAKKMDYFERTSRKTIVLD
jgi:chromosome segregation ATPase